MQQLKERVLRGGVAKVCSQGTILTVRLATLVVLARLIDPKDFGLVGMVTVVTGVFSLFRDAGLSVATVQRPSISVDEISTLFWLNILVGAMLALLSLATAPVLVAFYHEPRLFWVTAALASGFVLNAAGVQHSAILQREMRFSALALIEAFSMLVSCGSGIAMAIAGFGYWALVVMSVSLPAVSTFCLWLLAAWVPRLPRWDPAIGSMLRFGGTVTLNTLVVYVAYNAEKVLLGRYLGAEALGIYGRAYQLISIPSESLNGAIYLVAVSGLARLQGDLPRFRSFFLKGYSLILSLTLPITIASALFADEIIAIVLGPKWQAAAPSFRYLAPTIVAFALINPMGWFLFSSGRVVRSLKMALVIAPVVMIGYVLGLPYGASGVAIGYSAAMILLVVPMITWATHGTAIAARDVWRAIWPPFLAALIASGVGLAVQVFAGPVWPPFMRLTVGGSLTVLSYLAILLYVMNQRQFYVDLLRDVIGGKGIGPLRFLVARTVRRGLDDQIPSAVPVD
jgi:O-antigen/teichoic acid export membrane protein